MTTRKRMPYCIGWVWSETALLPVCSASDCGKRWCPRGCAACPIAWRTSLRTVGRRGRWKRENMTSPGQHSKAPGPESTASAVESPDRGQRTEQAVNEALARLGNLSDLPVSEHVERFDAVHTALTDALSEAENLLSGSNGNRS